VRERTKLYFEFVWGGKGGGGRKKMSENENYWNNPSVYECNVMHCTVNCWILGKHGDRKWISNGREGMIYTDLITKAKHPWTLNIYLIFLSEVQEGKIYLFYGWVSVRRGWAQGKGK
jgi:hypothetical protein